MPLARIVTEALPEPGAAVRITGEAVAHARARRLEPGTAVILVDGSGGEAVGRLVRRDSRVLEIFVESIRVAPKDALPPLTLSIAAIRAERLAWVAEKATELGAARLGLVTSDRTQRFRADARLLPRLERVVREAAKQSERARWPKIEGPSAFADVIRDEPSATRLILDPAGELFPSTLPSRPAALLVGPEGGWSDSEREAAIASGWSIASLAAGKLRAETAAVAALTLARSALSRRTRDA